MLVLGFNSRFLVLTGGYSLTLFSLVQLLFAQYTKPNEPF